MVVERSAAIIPNSVLAKDVGIEAELVLIQRGGRAKDAESLHHGEARPVDDAAGVVSRTELDHERSCPDAETGPTHERR